jgi:hypothetical protein
MDLNTGKPESKSGDRRWAGAFRVCGSCGGRNWVGARRCRTCEALLVGARAVSRPREAMVGRRSADKVLTPRVRGVAIGALVLAVAGGAVLLHLLRTDTFQDQPSAATTAAAPAVVETATAEAPTFEDPPSTLESTKALRAADQGRRLLARGNVKGAMSLLADAQKTLPDNAELAHLYGSALWRFRARDRAVFQYQRAFKLSPDNPVYREDLGRALSALGRTAEAAHLLQGSPAMVATELGAESGAALPPAVPAEEGVSLGGAGNGNFKGRSFSDDDLRRGRVHAPAPSPEATPVVESPR